MEETELNNLKGGHDMKRSIMRNMSLLILFLTFSLTLGCAGYRWVTEKGGLIPEALLRADQALEEAREEGKDKRCPKEFGDLHALRDRTYEVYWACRTQDAIGMAKDVTDRAKAFCPREAEKAPEPPPPVPKTEPKPIPPPKPAPAPRVIDKMTMRVNFDFDKAIIREGERPILMKAVEFIRKYPDARIVLEGHTCSIGTDQYNLGLSQRRAQAVKQFVEEKGGFDGSRITAVGYGESKPIESNRTREGRAHNRRVEVLIISE